MGSICCNFYDMSHDVDILFVIDDGAYGNTSHVENDTDNNVYANVEKSASAESQKPPEVRLLSSCIKRCYIC